MHWLLRLRRSIWPPHAATPPLALALIPAEVRAAEVSRHDRGIIDHSRHVSSIGRR